MKHPNAAVAAGGSGLSVFVVWLLGHLHVALSAEDGAVVAGAVASVALFVGHNGLKGLWRKIWNGQQGAGEVTLVAIGVILLGIILLVVKAY